MECGISTSCFYPMKTQESLALLQQNDVQTVEIFFNTFCEIEPAVIDALEAQLAQYNTRVTSFHPFSSGFETFFFASMYEDRIADGLRLYKRYFEVCEQLAIPRVVFHGDYTQTPFSFKKHCEVYLKLRKMAAQYGVEFCQENVVRCKCGNPEYIHKMREYTGDDVSFVLDVKQMRRSGVKMTDMLGAMSGKISHLHLSDETPTCDCALPGVGSFDFNALFKSLCAQGFTGDMVIELYRGDFKEIDDLLRAAKFLQGQYAANFGV